MGEEGGSSSAAFVSNAKILIRLQFLNRLLSFVLNTIVIRLTSPTALGLTTIKLDLFFKTILYLSREGPRLALLRYPRTTEPNARRWLSRLLSLSWLALASSPIPMAILLFAYALTVPIEVEENHLLRGFWLAMLGLLIAVLLELVAEPLYQVLRDELVGLRARVESMAMMARAVVVLLICWALQTGDDGIGVALIAFPLGQIIHSLVLMIGLGYYASEQYPGLLKEVMLSISTGRSAQENGGEGPPTELTSIVEHAHSMRRQLAFKYILAQGDMWLISLLTTLPAQGVYAVVSNYGSLVCRLLLAPIDEAALIFFSTAGGKESLRQLALLLGIYQLLGVLVLLLGPFLANPLTSLLLGDRWQGTPMPATLSAYCLLLPVMAMSGMLEAFVHSKIQGREALRRSQVMALLSTALFVGVSSYLTSRWGPVGMILGNVVNFGLRCVTSVRFIWSWCASERLPMGRELFMRSTLLRILLVFGTIFYLTSRFLPQVHHRLLVLALTPVILALIWRQERAQLLEVKLLLFPSDNKNNKRRRGE